MEYEEVIEKLPNELDATTYIAYDYNGVGSVHGEIPIWEPEIQLWEPTGLFFHYCVNHLRSGQLWQFNCARSIFVMIEDNMKMRKKPKELFAKNIIDILDKIVGKEEDK